jgi:hypothetical protein
MNNPTIDNSLSLESVQKQFEAWRTNRTKREPIPEPLWEAAASLCDHYPITHVCRRLRLSFADLKKRLPAKDSATNQFMELDTGCLTGGPWHLECERPDGSKLRFSGNGQAPAVEHLLLRFLS